MMIQGVTNSLNENADTAASAAGNVGTSMTDSMRKTLDGLSKVLGSDLIDFNPTITPVLDLSQVKKDAASLDSLLSLPTFDVSGAYANAKTASSSFESNRKAGEGDGQNGSSTNYTFNQTNNSPKALSAIEIYRQTDNVISRAKGGN
jgi:hypothetical protein